jgi:hypothetical protein
VADPKKAWTTCVLKAHGITPEWDDKNGLSKPCQAHLSRIDLHFHDRRREGACRWLEAGVPPHHVTAALGHTNLTTTTTYTSTSPQDLLATMRRVGEKLSALHTVAEPPTGEQPPAVQDGSDDPGEVTVN